MGCQLGLSPCWQVALEWSRRSSPWRALLLFLVAALPAAAAPQPAARDAILVLGQSLRPDGSAPETLVRRVDKAAELYHQYPKRGGVAVVASGGDPASVGSTEAAAMRRLLLQRGVPDADVRVEGQALTTVENVLYSIPILRSLGVDGVTVVTSDFHMPRSSLIVEAVLRNQTRPGEFAITLAHAEGGCANQDAPPGVDVNEESLVQRLRREVQNVRGKMHERFFTSKPLGIRIPIPDDDRMRHALYELEVQLAAATAAAPALGSPGLRRAMMESPEQSMANLPAFLAVAAMALCFGMLMGSLIQGRWARKNVLPYMALEGEEPCGPPSPCSLGVAAAV